MRESSLLPEAPKTAPAGEDLLAQLASTLLDPQATLPVGALRGGASAEARWSVYRNNVMHSLVQALADTYPVVQELVGEDFFRTAAARYVRQQPPTSPVLWRFGGRFDHFLRRYAPAAGLPYLPGVARLEWLRVQAFHLPDPPGAPGAPDSSAPTRVPFDTPAQALARHLDNPETLPLLHFRLKPWVQLLRSAHPVVSIWAAHQRLASFEDIFPGRPELAVISRDDSDALVTQVDLARWAFLSALRRGQPLGSASARASTLAQGLGQPFDLSGALAMLLQHNWVHRIDTPHRSLG